MSLKNYESVIILTPVLSEQQMKDTVAGFRGLITEQGGQLVHENNWGLAKLAYPINKKVTGFYHILEFQAEPEFISTLELSFRRDERVMRYLTTKLDKHAVIYNERKRKGEIGQGRANSTAAETKRKDKIVLTDDLED